MSIIWHENKTRKYIVSSSPGSDVSTQMQVLSACTHSVFVCVISLGAHDLELRFTKKRATSLLGDDEMECIIRVVYKMRASGLPKLLADAQIAQTGNPPDCHVLHPSVHRYMARMPQILADYQI